MSNSRAACVVVGGGFLLLLFSFFFFFCCYRCRFVLIDFIHGSFFSFKTEKMDAFSQQATKCR